MASLDLQPRPRHHAADADAAPTAGLVPRLEGHRRELQTHCRRMLGSGFEAEDAVQETLVRAWRALDRLEDRSSLRAWLYRIATNVCINMLRGPQRRARPMDLVGAPHPEAVAEPGEAQVTTDPAEVAASRDAVRRAFVVALQTLPPQQRAVLILREVLRWRAHEVAALLGATEASVNSALQRARTTLAANANANAATEADTGPTTVRADPDDDTQRALLTRYVDAFERTDVQSLVALLRLDHQTRHPG
jgi:RNA polymerase sigma-70 factor (ECF subfamily)